MPHRQLLRLAVAALLQGAWANAPAEACSRSSGLTSGEQPPGDCKDNQELRPSAVSLLQRLSSRDVVQHFDVEEWGQLKDEDDGFIDDRREDAVAHIESQPNGQLPPLLATELAAEMGTKRSDSKAHTSERLRLHRFLSQHGLALEERFSVASGEENCRWQPASECVPAFRLAEESISGCSNSNSLRPWCSHNETYAGLWSRCEYECSDSADVGGTEYFTWGSAQDAGQYRPVW